MINLTYLLNDLLFFFIKFKLIVTIKLLKFREKRKRNKNDLK